MGRYVTDVKLERIGRPRRIDLVVSHGVWGESQSHHHVSHGRIRGIECCAHDEPSLQHAIHQDGKW
jgi:hypothetical protein